MFMITETQFINSLEKLPESLTVDQVIDHLIFLEKIQKGIDDFIKGSLNTKQEAKVKLEKWLK